MVRAILDGRKTQTRRIVKTTPSTDTTEILHDEGTDWREWFSHSGIVLPKSWTIKCPYGQVGDQLWVKENFHLGAYVREPHAQGAAIAYAEGKQTCFRHMTDAEMERCRLKPDPRPWAESKTIPCLLMPRWASRLTLKITSIRVERLQDISEADAMAEGANPTPNPKFPKLAAGQHVRGYKHLWDSINAEKGPGEHGYSWEGNPWVWVITFNPI